MPTTQQRQQHQDMEQHQRELLNALIGEQVLYTLGEPGDLFKVQVRLLWGNYYRVNVLLGADATCARIAKSLLRRGRQRREHRQVIPEDHETGLTSAARGRRTSSPPWRLP
jgi:hypothetical protein